MKAGRALFTRQGYAETAREDICARAGVTRGALDHHFDGKKGLFRAIVDDVEGRLNQLIAEAAMREADPVEALRAGCRAYLDAATDPEVRRIILLDAKSVLGWDAWQEIHEQHGLALTREGIRAAMASGRVRDANPEPLAMVLLATLNEVALYVATADDPDSARAEARETADRVLDAVLATPRRG